MSPIPRAIQILGKLGGNGSIHELSGGCDGCISLAPPSLGSSPWHPSSIRFSLEGRVA